MNIGELYALLTLHAAQFEAGLAKAEGATKGFGNSAGSVFAGIAKKVALLGAAVVGAAVAIGIEGLRVADGVVKAQALIAVAYGGSAKALDNWTAKQAVALGVTQEDLDKSLSTWGVYAKGVGLSTDQAASYGEDLAKRAAQISAVTGTSFDDVFTALEKGVQGATRGLKTYGVAIDTNSLKQEALTLGIYNGKGALDLHQKALATEALIMQQTTPYVTAFGTAQNTVGFQMKDVGVMINDAMIKIGDAVTPIAAIIMPLLLRAVDNIVKAVPAVIQFFRDAVAAATPAARVILDVAGGIVKVAQGIISFLTQGETFKGVLIALALIVATIVLPPMVAWAAATVAATWPFVALGIAVMAVIKVLDHFGLIGPIITNVSNVIGKSMGWLSTNVFPIFQKWFEGIGVVVTAAFKVIEAVWNAAASATDTIVKAIFGSWNGLAGALGGVWNVIVSAARAGVNMLIDIVNTAISALDLLQVNLGNVHAGINIGQIPHLVDNGPGTQAVPQPGLTSVPDKQTGLVAHKETPAEVAQSQAAWEAGHPTTVGALAGAMPTAGSNAAATAAARTAATQMKTAVVDAYAAMTLKAHEYFDAVHTANLKSIDDARNTANATLDAQEKALTGTLDAARQALADKRSAQQLASLQAGVASAADPAALAAAQQALSDFQDQAAVDALDKQTTAQIATLEAQKKANDATAALATTAENLRATTAKASFDAELKQTKDALSTKKIAYQKANDELLALLKSYGVSYADAGVLLGKAFAAGLSSSVKNVETATAKAGGGSGTKVPGFSGGVANFSGGPALIGEKGPEVLNLPSGSSVTPLGGGVTVNVPIQNFSGTQDNIEQLSRAIGQQVRLATVRG